MKLENMSAQTSTDPTGDEDELNFEDTELPSSIAEVETRENGDGDSGGECNNKLDQQVSLQLSSNTDLKKSKVSKIPIRQTNTRKSSFILTNHSDDNESYSLLVSGEQKLQSSSNSSERNDEIDTKTKEKTDCSGSDESWGKVVVVQEGGEANDDNNTKDGGSEIESEGSTRRVSDDDIPDIVNDSDVNGHEADLKMSLNPRDLEVAILEAPEEFRCFLKSDEQVDSVAVPEERASVVPPQRDDDNASKAETGDTSRRAMDDDDEHDGENSSPSTVVPCEFGACVCADESCDGGGGGGCRPTLDHSSIEIGVVQCAQASGCSRVSTVEVCVAHHPNNSSICAHQTDNTAALQPLDNLPIENCDFVRPQSWCFKNGRLVFNSAEEKVEQVVALHSKTEIEELSSLESESLTTPLTSKELNKRIDDGTSRLKYLEQKLKEAGITDDDDESSSPKCIEQVVVDNDFCQFDVRQVGTFSLYNNSYIQVYDELEDSSTSSALSSSDEDENVIVNDDDDGRRDGTTAANMGIDGERADKHNPDRDNLKSLLKRPGGNPKSKRSNRVVFNENKNEFFDADYIILIREECDYDEDDDDGVCTCNQHEMVRLECCEPNCNCSVYDQTPQSPKFAPPLEFVDAVTLSPPEGYKDMELGEQQLLALKQMARSRGQQQRTAVCRECSVAHDDDEYGDGSQSDNEETGGEHEELEEKEKTDQSQQTTPTTPPNDSDTSPNSQKYILETITMTTVTEQKILREAEEERRVNVPPGGSPINGILKGGRLWKQQSLDGAKTPELQQVMDAAAASDEEGSNHNRSVRFIESYEDKRDGCGDGASDNPPEEDEKPEKSDEQTKENNSSSISPESTEMMLTFKLGNHVLISNNSLKPNSAVRQLFPCTKPSEDDSIHQYLVTAESLRAFEEAKRSKLPQIIQSGETDDSIKRAIERNTLRRSLIRYEPRSKKNIQKSDNSLVERIKQLTCDVDDQNPEQELRSSPPGEEAANPPTEVLLHPNVNNKSDKSFSPSSSSSSSNSSSMSSTYKKITDLFGKRADQNALPPNDLRVTPVALPDLGNGGNNHLHDDSVGSNKSNESRKQFLAPLSACVSGMSTTDEYYYHMNHVAGESRASVASSVGTEYSLEDIDEGLKHNGEDVVDSKRIAPDVLAGTPSASESGDELAMFVQQDASRIERIKKKYQPEQQQQQASKEEDDEHDDYGFNRRPSVRGIKPKFGSTTEILQQIQNQIQHPAATTTTAPRVAWPYYSESGLTSSVVDNKGRNSGTNINQNMANYQYPAVPAHHQYRPTSLQADDNMYQNCSNQRCVREVYRTNVNQTYSTVMKVGGEYYQSLPNRGRSSGRPLSPPPLEMSKTYHQTMVYIPRNHIEPQQYYQSSSDYVRVSNQNQINKSRYVEPIYQQRILHVDGDHHYPPNMVPPKGMMVRVPYSQQQQQQQQQMIASRSESPSFSTSARSTQTPVATCNNYPPYGGRPSSMVVTASAWQGDGTYVTKMNRFGASPATAVRYPPSSTDNISLTESISDSQIIPNGYQHSHHHQGTFLQSKDLSIPNSPTKPVRFIERGVPEGAASNPLQDSVITSPTSPQNPSTTNAANIQTKPLFYAMNV